MLLVHVVMYLVLSYLNMFYIFVLKAEKEIKVRSHTFLEQLEAANEVNSKHKLLPSTFLTLKGFLEKEKQRKEQLEKLKKGLMQDLLTGRVRVRVS